MDLIHLEMENNLLKWEIVYMNMYTCIYCSSSVSLDPFVSLVLTLGMMEYIEHVIWILIWIAGEQILAARWVGLG